MPKTYTTKEIGSLGEDIACNFLKSKGFSIAERNFLRKWGEIDIVAEKANGVHFVEVKSVTHEKMLPGSTISHGTDRYRPEENVHTEKMKRMRRVIQSYILERRMEDRDWQFDIVTVLLDIKDKKATCRLMSNIIL